MVDDVEHQYRKNLMIVSSIMLIYSVAGGEFGGDITLSGIPIRFKSPQYIEWLGLVIMYFLWWRHWLVSESIRDRMKMLVMGRLVLSAWSVMNIFREFLPRRKVTVNPEGCCLTSDNKWMRPVGFGDGKYTLSDLRVFSIAPVEVFFGPEVEKVINHLNGDRKYDFRTAYRMNLFRTKCSVFIDYCRSYVLCALREPSFGDGLLPSIIVVASTIGFILNKL
ncbi:hypothetical protein G9455_11725 [Aeromonas hydrophila]|nr:hypothetical protein [Aeromonas hydrophila]MCA4698018.1 hypothetical protein [Aeromonas hydrophila]QIO18471.1 hypothetical protein G9455_11725 [Aeromonas hydrophila]UUT52642.1 hypothetical protein MOO39_11275 [Aeromonas hydrophila]CAD7534735.1 hypothetical protein KBAHV46_23110 [Aeromonas hydrophila]CAD7534803.1 hypothetical protein KBAHV27_23190 [Aeromonas hydrophila]